MPYEDFQNDLFGGQEGQNKPKKRGISGRRFLPNIKIPLEHTVIAAVVVMVLIIIAYAVGVEQGKKIILSKRKAVVSENDIMSDDNSIEDFELEVDRDEADVLVETSSDVVDPESETEILPIDDKVAVSKETEVAEDTGFTTLYTIQLASFKDLNAAIGEMEKVKDNGFSAEYAQRGDWYQVYATGYHSIEEAKKAQAELIDEYSDCFIRKIK